MAAVVLIAGTGLLVMGLRGHQRTLGGPGQLDPLVESAQPLARAAAPKVAPAARSVPVSLRIPAIGVAVPVSALGLQADGTVQTPSNYAEPGWFRLGPTPGQLGSAVILGHVDSYRGPAVFFRLQALRAGDRVDVTLADGVVVHFAVRRVVTYPKDQFPARLVYGSHGFSALQLVTCGGVFDTQTRSYLSNVVAYTALVSTTPSGV